MADIRLFGGMIVPLVKKKKDQQVCGGGKIILRLVEFGSLWDMNI